MITTSKIKTVVSSKPHTGANGTTIYHNLEMENGDKINIGKKKLQSVGWELTYEIVDEGQEYNKAKSAQKVETANPVNNGSGSFAPKNEGVQRLIVAQNSMTNATNYGIEMGMSLEEVESTAKRFFNFVIQLGGENGSN